MSDVKQTIKIVHVSEKKVSDKKKRLPGQTCHRCRNSRRRICLAAKKQVKIYIPTAQSKTALSSSTFCGEDLIKKLFYSMGPWSSVKYE